VASALSIQGWAHSARAALGVARPEIDALNVFPVPDGDTGTNVYLTMEAACAAADEAAASGSNRAEVARALARGAMLGARGNSGVIVSEYLRGLGDALCRLPDAREIGGTELAAMLGEGAETAYRAVSRPVEGTILTVARAAAQAAEQAGADTVQVARQAAQSARIALGRTPTQLPALAAAGVVDAGGRALVVILDALVGFLTGEEVPGHEAAILPSQHRPSHQPTGPAYDGPAYEVMYLLDTDPTGAQELRAELEGMGDSVLVVGDGALWRVHAHVDDAGAAIEAALARGRPHRIQVTVLAAEYDHRPVEVDRSSSELGREVVERDGESGNGARLNSTRALVAVVHGRGIADLLASLGVHIVWAEPAQRPSTTEFLDAIANVGAPEIVLLPSDKDTQPVAEVAARQARAQGRRIAVIPTRAVVQTLAAIAVHDPSLAFEDDTVAMTRAASATRYAAVTIASRTALTSAGPCQVGDCLGLVDGDIALVGPSVDEVARGVLDAMLAVGGELVTLVLGSGAQMDFGQHLVDWLGVSHPTVEVSLVQGGQPLWPVIIGVE